jgi:ribosomal-protein-alanine N-acetyltransferase
MADAETPLSTQRLELEPLRVEHAGELHAALSDPDLYHYMDERPPASLAALEERYRKLAGRGNGTEVWLNYACRERASGEVAGLVQATITPGAPALIAYLFPRRGQGRGLAREACRALVASLTVDWSQAVIEATVETANTRSIALLRALDFHHTTTSGTEERYRRG